MRQSLTQIKICFNHLLTYLSIMYNVQFIEELSWNTAAWNTLSTLDHPLFVPRWLFFSSKEINKIHQLVLRSAKHSRYHNCVYVGVNAYPEEEYKCKWDLKKLRVVCKNFPVSQGRRYIETTTEPREKTLLITRGWQQDPFRPLLDSASRP